MDLKQTARLTFAHGGLKVNGSDILFERTQNGILRDLYVAAGLNYPRYFKMDALSKLCMACTELLIDRGRARHILNDRCAILLANSASSLDSDLAYLQGLITTGRGSPAQFVYTLPNVMIGELCIRHRLHVHTEMYVMPSPNLPFLSEQAQSLIGTGVCDAALIGWVDVLGEMLNADLSIVVA